MAQLEEQVALAPNFTLPDLDGKPLTLSACQGKKILVFM